MEAQHTTAQNVERAVRTILAQYDDITREGLKDTPSRVARMYEELLNPPTFQLTEFDSGGYDEMIIETNIHFYSLCEHHLIPFFGTVAVGYIPEGRIVGLSKLIRTVDYFSRRLHTQERMTQQIAEFLMQQLTPRGVGVLVQARHLCQEMRGIRKHGVITTTSKLLGLFMSHAEVRNEFLTLAHRASKQC
jgi:GTP cyclohydrolase I